MFKISFISLCFSFLALPSLRRPSFERLVRIIMWLLQTVWLLGIENREWESCWYACPRVILVKRSWKLNKDNSLCGREKLVYFLRWLMCENLAQFTPGLGLRLEKSLQFLKIFPAFGMSGNMCIVAEHYSFLSFPMASYGNSENTVFQLAKDS